MYLDIDVIALYMGLLPENMDWLVSWRPSPTLGHSRMSPGIVPHRIYHCIYDEDDEEF
jgi:hypothetical protein